MRDRTQAVVEHIKDKLNKLTPGTSINYFKRKEDDIFGKSQGSTMSAATTIHVKHVHKYNGDKGICACTGPIKVKNVGLSHEVVRT